VAHAVRVQMRGGIDRAVCHQLGDADLGHGPAMVERRPAMPWRVPAEGDR
jgi:hypothetical protein